MLERTLFDQSLNSIRHKYQLISTTATTTPSNDQQLQFVTPVRPNKHTINKTATHTNGKQKQVCYTARNKNSKADDIDVFITEKQNILKQRMEQNQRILMKSKELRDKQTRNNSQQHKPTPIKQQINHKQQSSIHQNYHSITECRTALTARDATPVSAKLKMEEANHKARKVFAQKINQLIDQSLQSKQMLVLQDKKDNIRQQKVAVNTITLTRKQGQRVDQNKLNVQQDKFKVLTVFENTSKIQERVKVLLSSH